MMDEWPTRAIALACTMACSGAPSPGDADGAHAAAHPETGCPAGTLQEWVDAAGVGGTVVVCDRPEGHPGPVVLRHDITLVGPATILGGPGPAVHVTAGHARLVDLTLRGGTGAVEPRLGPDTYGGVLAAWEADALTVEDSVLEGGSADWGGCVAGPRNGPLTLRRTTVSGCRATKVGGGVWIRQGGLEDSVVQDNRAPYGGGIAVRSLSVADGDVFLPGTTVEHNHADVQGGGMLVTGPVDVFGGTVLGNTSEQGAGALFSDATGGWFDGTASANVASVGGGGVFVRGGQVTLGALVLDANEASGDALADGRGVGGGLWVSGDDTTRVALDDVQLQANTAAWGGGLMAAGAHTVGPLVWATGGSFDTNHADDGGGAAVVGARLVLDATDVRNNDHHGILLDDATLWSRGGAWSNNTPADIGTASDTFDGGADDWTACDASGCGLGVPPD